MSQLNYESAHAALQGLKDQPAALQRFQEALAGLSAATNLPFDSDTLTYVANTLINQRHINANAALVQKAGSGLHGGFVLQAAIDPK
jgi:hypothetical protein